MTIAGASIKASLSATATADVLERLFGGQLAPDVLQGAFEALKQHSARQTYAVVQDDAPLEPLKESRHSGAPSPSEMKVVIEVLMVPFTLSEVVAKALNMPREEVLARMKSKNVDAEGHKTHGSTSMRTVSNRNLDAAIAALQIEGWSIKGHQKSRGQEVIYRPVAPLKHRLPQRQMGDYA